MSQPPQLPDEEAERREIIERLIKRSQRLANLRSEVRGIVKLMVASSAADQIPPNLQDAIQQDRIVDQIASHDLTVPEITAGHNLKHRLKLFTMHYKALRSALRQSRAILRELMQHVPADSILAKTARAAKRHVISLARSEQDIGIIETVRRRKDS